MAMHPSRQAYVEEAQEDEDQGISLADLPIDRDHNVSMGAGIAPEKASAILAQFERRRQADAIAVPTNDGQVRAKLRSMGEPITLFGEDAADRRGRLRMLMLGQEGSTEMEGVEQIGTADADSEQEEDEAEEEFYTEGSPELLQARKDIAQYSVPRAARRARYQKAESAIHLNSHRKHRKTVKERLGQVDLYGSQIAGDRPVSIVRFAPDGQTLAAGNWGGSIKLLDVPTLEEKGTLKPSTERVGGLSWYPGATLPESGVTPDSLNFASGDSKGDLYLWSLTSEQPLTQLQGHTGRVCRVEFHPAGHYLASASDDTTWRLWDVRTSTELQIQEGHSRGVFAISFNADGSLVASAGLDSIGRVWDLRTGRTVMILGGDKGHVQPVHALDWGADSHRVLSGGADGWLKAWDIRKVDCVASVGGHRSIVSDLRWFKGTDGPFDYGAPDGQGGGREEPEKDEKGEPRPKKASTFFVSSGYDKNVNVFSADDWVLVKSLSGHSGNVMSVDVNTDGKWIASSGQDRTVKIWGRDDQSPL